MKALAIWVKHYPVYRLELSKEIFTKWFWGYRWFWRYNKNYNYDEPIGLSLRKDLSSSLVEEYALRRKES
jgi:hypothetical protein